MKMRQVPHTSALSSTAYDVGGRMITLLPGDPLMGLSIGPKLDRAIEEVRRPYVAAQKLVDDPDVPEHQRAEAGLVPDPNVPNGVLCIKALAVGAAWDDPNYELETSVPDDLESMTDAGLLTLALSILAELASKSVRRLLQPMALLSAGLKTLSVGHDTKN